MPSILIVDDDVTIRGMFARAMKTLGDVEQAGNGAEALRMLASKKYSIVLLDLHMPVVDGFVILHTLSTMPGPNRDTPVYVLTADVSEQARVRALQRHAVSFLTKPVPIGTLMALVEATLKKGAQRPTASARDGSHETPLPSTSRPSGSPIKKG